MIFWPSCLFRCWSNISIKLLLSQNFFQKYVGLWNVKKNRKCDCYRSVKDLVHRLIYIQHGKVAQIVTKDTVNWYSGSHCQSPIWLIFMLHNKIAINSPLTCGLSCLGDFENHWMTCSSLGLFHWNLLWGAPRSAGTLKVTRPAWWCSGVGLGPWDFPWGVAATQVG